VDRVHRQQLKHDRFIERVGDTVEYASEHRQQMVKVGIAAIVVLLAGVGIYWYMQHQAAARQDAFRTAIRTQEAQVGQAASDFLVTFPTQAEKEKAVTKAWQELANKYSGSTEGAIAHYYMGINAADRGDTAEAEKQFKIVADSGKDAYASQAKLALARIYESSGRAAEAEKLLRSLIDDPTILVSKDQATLALGRLLAKTKPAEARKLLEPLRTERGAASRQAITALSEIPAR
jgi:TolA-binding protein